MRTFYSDPADVAAVNRQLARHARVQVASIRRRHDPRPLAERIADAMLEIAHSGQTVSSDALTLRGFTRIELSQSILARARDIANVRAVRQLGAEAAL